MIQTIYYRYLYRRYVFARRGNQVEGNLSPDDLLEEMRKSLPDSKATREYMSAALEIHWKSFSIRNEVAAFLKDHPLDAAGALHAIPSRYRTDGDEGDWRGDVNIWMKYSYLGVEGSPKSKDYQTLQIDGILNVLWCSWKRLEEIAPHATIIPVEQPHWDISTCMKANPTPTSKSLTIFFRSLYWRYTTALYDDAQVNLPQGDFLSEITKSLPNCSSEIVQRFARNFYIPNELAEFLQNNSPCTYADALKAIPSRYRTDGDEKEWRNRVAVWWHYSHLGAECYTEGFQTLKSESIRKYLWCNWQSYGQQSLQAAVPGKRPFDEPEETFTAKQPKTAEPTEPSHPVRHRRPILAAPILVHAAIPPRRKESVVEETDPIAVADALLAMKYH